MSIPRHQQRRNRTLRVEVLESRELLSTAGPASRTVAAIARMSHFVVFSGRSEATVIQGNLQGTGHLVGAAANQIQFSSGGFVTGGPLGVLVQRE